MTVHLPLLGTTDHSRDSAALTYVYPVVSRRSGGVSLGINLNVNNACNWHCIYCQVPQLVRGSAPAADLELLGAELRGFLKELLHGDFMTQRVAPEARRLNDIALSGNGEPTSAPNFAAVVSLVGEVMAEFELTGKVKLVLITNGSLLHRPQVQQGLRAMARLGGEIWFKLDRVTPQGLGEINGSREPQGRIREHLRIAAALCPTWLQTAVFALDGHPPANTERAAWLAFVETLAEQEIRLAGVLLYALARPSLQAGAARLSAIDPAWLAAFAADIRACGLPVRLSE